MPRAFMTDPDQLESLEGQQYVLLRPAGPVADFYEKEQSSIRAGLPHSVTSPQTGHVTLRGFSEPARISDVKSTIADWATRQEPIHLDVAAVDGFPPPFQILIARLHRTTSLVNAYAALTSTVEATGLQRISELPLDQWVFHLSLFYCGALGEDQWRSVHERYARDVELPVSEVVSEAELVWYENGVEYSEVMPFTGHL